MTILRRSILKGNRMVLREFDAVVFERKDAEAAKDKKRKLDVEVANADKARAVKLHIAKLRVQDDAAAASMVT